MTETKEIKVGIVGPSKPKWKSEEQYEKMKSAIRFIITKYAQPYRVYNNKWNIFDLDFSNITVVSGHCPVGEERYFDITYNDWIPKHLKLTGLEYAKEENHKLIKVYDQGGVDTETEIIATQLGAKTKIFPAEVHQWGDLRTNLMSAELVEKHKNFKDQFVKLKGYRTRNLEIANFVNVLYCIVPKIEGTVCKYHFNNMSSHPKNGGCWTYHETEKLGKETQLIVIS